MPVSSEMHISVEKAKDKARRMMGQVVAVDTETSVAVGTLSSVDVERISTSKIPICKLTMENGVRFRKDQTFSYKMGECEFVFINKPEMIVNGAEFEHRFPKIHTEVSLKTRMGSWW